MNIEPIFSPADHSLLELSCTIDSPSYKWKLSSEAIIRNDESSTPSQHNDSIFYTICMVIDNISEGICLYDSNGRLILCNSRYADILGVDHSIMQKGTPFARILEAAFELVPNSRLPNGSIAVPPERTVVHPLGTHREAFIGDRVVSIRKRLLPNGGWISTLDDITERRKMEDRLLRLARHDELTGLANRASFLDSLGTAMEPTSMLESCTLLYLDLDHFKPINDKLGHQAGDAVLQVVAERLRAPMREQDLAARLGGDEFAILLGHMNPSSVDKFANSLIANVQRPIQVRNEQVTVGVSIGIATAPQHGMTPELLMSNADRALYSAKRKGRNCFWRYGSESNGT